MALPRSLKRFVHLLFLAATIGAFGACGYAPIKPGTYIETKGVWALRTYEQEGRKVGIDSVLSEIRKYDGSSRLGTRAENLYWLSLVPAAVGGYCFGDVMFTGGISTERRDRTVAIGIGALVLSVIGAYVSDYYAQQALEIYNSDIKKKKWWMKRPDPEITIEPEVSLLPGGAGASIKWSY